MFEDNSTVDFGYLSRYPTYNEEFIHKYFSDIYADINSAVVPKSLQDILTETMMTYETAAIDHLILYNYHRSISVNPVNFERAMGVIQNRIDWQIEQGWIDEIREFSSSERATDDLRFSAPGSYVGYNTKTCEIYVGESLNVIERWKAHAEPEQVIATKDIKNNRYRRMHHKLRGIGDYEHLIFMRTTGTTKEDTLKSQDDLIAATRPLYSLNIMGNQIPYDLTKDGYHRVEDLPVHWNDEYQLILMSRKTRIQEIESMIG